MLWFLLAIPILGLVLSFICFMLVCYAPRKKTDPEAFPLPPGKTYEPYLPVMLAGMKEVRAMKHKSFTIRSFDGLKLAGRYYEFAPGAPLEIMFHG